MQDYYSCNSLVSTFFDDDSCIAYFNKRKKDPINKNQKIGRGASSIPISKGDIGMNPQKQSSLQAKVYKKIVGSITFACTIWIFLSSRWPDQEPIVVTDERLLNSAIDKFRILKLTDIRYYFAIQFEWNSIRILSPNVI